MGSGKSSLAERLGERLQIPSWDIDQELEQRYGTSIAAQWKQSGETVFRVRETNMMKSVAGRSSAVIATGGGAVRGEPNILTMRSSGKTVYLYASPAVIFARLKQDEIGARPLLSSSPDPSRTIADLCQQRDPIYRLAADHVLDTDEQSPEQLTNQLVSLWEIS